MWACQWWRLREGKIQWLKQTTLVYSFLGINTIFVSYVHVDMSDSKDNRGFFFLIIFILKERTNKAPQPLVLPAAHQPDVYVFISCCEGSALRKCCCLLLPHTIVSFQLTHINIRIILTSELVILSLNNAYAVKIVSDLGLIWYLAHQITKLIPFYFFRFH